MDDSNCTPAIGFDRRVIEFPYKNGTVIDVDIYRFYDNEE